MELEAAPESDFGLAVAAQVLGNPTQFVVMFESLVPPVHGLAQMLSGTLIVLKFAVPQRLKIISIPDEGAHSDGGRGTGDGEAGAEGDNSGHS
jgi:hypothetical protein